MTHIFKPVLRHIALWRHRLKPSDQFCKCKYFTGNAVITHDGMTAEYKVSFATPCDYELMWGGHLKARTTAREDSLLFVREIDNTTSATKPGWDGYCSPVFTPATKVLRPADFNGSHLFAELLVKPGKGRDIEQMSLSLIDTTTEAPAVLTTLHMERGGIMLKKGITCRWVWYEYGYTLPFHEAA